MKTFNLYRTLALCGVLVSACTVDTSDSPDSAADDGTTLSDSRTDEGLPSTLGAVEDVPGEDGADLAVPPDSPEARHCVMELPFQETTCYSSFREAMAYASGGAILDAPDDGLDAAYDEELAVRINDLAFNEPQFSSNGAPKADIVLAQFYDDPARGGGSLTVHSSRVCTITGSDIDASLNLKPAWNDRISSMRTFADCAVKLWENPNFTGVSTELLFSTDYVGDAIDNRASSLQFS